LNPAEDIDVELTELSELFYSAAEGLGRFQKIVADEIPETARELLAHDGHMTVTVERFHHCGVDVQVLQTLLDGDLYSRKILLTRQSDAQVVMFGIVRMNLGVMAPQVRAEIESQQIPLGRILIDHNVLRAVKLRNLFRIEPGAELQGLFGLREGQPCFGRTALIFCDGRPAIELLEVV
jgi:chorismate-pyruvate lyase